MKNLLITGATGFIGSHLVEAAASEGYQVFALVRQSSNVNLLKQAGIQMVYGDITDKTSLRKAFQQLKTQGLQIDYVIHCAGKTKGRNLEEFMIANCTGTAFLLEALKETQARIKKIIFLSSLAASGPTTLNEVIAIDAQMPITDYGKSKLNAEAVVKNSGFPFLILRPTAVYGPREKDIFTLFKLLKKGINPVIGFHQQQLTFIYIKDLIKVILIGLQSSKSEATYFVSDGNIYNKLQLAECIEKSLNKKTKKITIPLSMVKCLAFLSQTYYGLQNKWSPLNLEKFKELKAQSWVCSVDETFKALNYIPKYNLESGVLETTHWYEKEKWI